MESDSGASVTRSCETPVMRWRCLTNAIFGTRDSWNSRLMTRPWTITTMLVTTLVLALSVTSYAWAGTRVMQRVGKGEVTSLFTDGDRYAAWVRFDAEHDTDPDAPAPVVPFVTVLDVRTSKIRQFALPAACHPRNASAGLLVARCETGPQYTLKLSTGELREVGASVPGYTNDRVGRRWIQGQIDDCNNGVNCLYFEDRATGQVIRKTRESGVGWDLDATPLRRLRHCGKAIKAPYDPALSGMDGDLGLVRHAEGDPKETWLEVQRCHGRPVTLDRHPWASHVTRTTVVWSTYCDYDPRPRCRSLVKARRMSTGRRTTWHLPAASANGFVYDVNQLPGWVFALRVTRRGSDSYGDPYAYALYKAPLPR